MMLATEHIIILIHRILHVAGDGKLSSAALREIDLTAVYRLLDYREVEWEFIGISDAPFASISIRVHDGSRYGSEETVVLPARDQVDAPHLYQDYPIRVAEFLKAYAAARRMPLVYIYMRLVGLMDNDYVLVENAEALSDQLRMKVITAK